MSEECIDFEYRTTGLAIREFLMVRGEASPYEFYKCFKLVKPTTSYKNIAYYFYLLKKLGLVEVVRREPSSKRGFDKTIYRIVPGMENDPRWSAPQVAMYPETRIGGRRYKMIKGI